MFSYLRKELLYKVQPVPILRQNGYRIAACLDGKKWLPSPEKIEYAPNGLWTGELICISTEARIDSVK